jgi:DNA-binding NtrC family response regulator
MKNILIVEDEASVRESLRDWLIDLGYQAEVTSDGEEALKRTAEKDFDLVILDLRLPGKNGLQVLREVRAQNPELKGIIITAYPNVETAAEALKGGAIDFLAKPIDLARLEKIVRENTAGVELRKKPILIVDDEAIIRDSLRDWFLESGYQAETATDGEEALRRMGKQKYGLLVLDLKLPGINGIEVLKEAKRRYPDVKGIIMTAYPSVDTAVEAIREGAIDYLPKPFPLSALEKVVAENIEPAHAEMIRQPLSIHAIGAILKILDRAAEDSHFLSSLANSEKEALLEYPELSDEEKEALMDGNIAKIESWVGRLDQRRGTWLWCRLSQEKW